MTKYGVYVIEFLRADDYTDGENLHEILKLSLVPTTYKWVDTKSELKAALNDFNKSKFRYLHVSCHADETGFELNGDDLTNAEFEQLTKTLLKDKRIFLSACKGANRDIATRMVVNNKAYSLIGVPVDLDFDKSALFWPSFYHLLNEIDSNKMKRDQIVDVLKKLVNLFNIPVNYYSRIRESNKNMRRLKLRKGFTDNRIIKGVVKHGK
jgi:hypothetical protein